MVIDFLVEMIQATFMQQVFHPTPSLVYETLLCLKCRIHLLEGIG